MSLTVIFFFRGGLQEKVVKHNRKAAEESLDLVNREKQHKMNELDVVVPLRLNQVTSSFENCGVPLLIKPSAARPSKALLLSFPSS